MKLWDFAVVGAGPSGAMTALRLARSGASVLLIEKEVFPRYKVCGACLNAAAISALNAAGLGDLPDQARAVPLSGFHWMRKGRQSELPLSGGYSLSRARLDQHLVNACREAGVVFQEGARADLEKTDPDKAVLRVQTEGRHDRIEARSLIAACGIQNELARSQNRAPRVEPASSVGAGAVFTSPSSAYRAGIIYMATGSDGYCGLVRLEDGSLNAAAAIRPRALRGLKSLPAAAEKILSEAGAEVPAGLREAHWQGTPALTRQHRQFSLPRCFFVGDAAGYVEPFTGEGMAWAFEEAGLLTALLEEHQFEWSETLALQWQHVMQRFFHRRTFWCRRLQGLLRSNIPQTLVHSLVGRFPRLAQPVLQTHGEIA